MGDEQERWLRVPALGIDEPVGMVVLGRRRWWHRLLHRAPRAKLYQAVQPGEVPPGGTWAVTWDADGTWRIED